MLYECTHCQFAKVDDVTVRTSSGKVLVNYTDSQGVHHTTEEQGPEP